MDTFVDEYYMFLFSLTNLMHVGGICKWRRNREVRLHPLFSHQLHQTMASSK